jgi:phytol kinase
MDETYRQTIHLSMGLLGAWILLTLDPHAALIFLAVALVLAFLACDFVSRGYSIFTLKRIMDETERKKAIPYKGGIAYAIGALFCLIIFGNEIAAVGLVTLGVLDSISTLVGLRFGRHKVRGKKSLEGTLSGSVAAALALLVLVPVPEALLVAGVSGLAELYSPIEDNLAIQVVACTTLALAALAGL